MNEREAIDRILKEDPPCGGGWDLRDGFLGDWHCQDCGAKRPQDCPYLKPNKPDAAKEKE